MDADDRALNVPTAKGRLRSDPKRDDSTPLENDTLTRKSAPRGNLLFAKIDTPGVRNFRRINNLRAIRQPARGADASACRTTGFESKAQQSARKARLPLRAHLHNWDETPVTPLAAVAGKASSPGSPYHCSRQQCLLSPFPMGRDRKCLLQTGSSRSSFPDQCRRSSKPVARWPCGRPSAGLG
jgi:hypothetical protein